MKTIQALTALLFTLTVSAAAQAQTILPGDSNAKGDGSDSGRPGRYEPGNGGGGNNGGGNNGGGNHDNGGGHSQPPRDNNNGGGGSSAQPPRYEPPVSHDNGGGNNGGGFGGGGNSRPPRDDNNNNNGGGFGGGGNSRPPRDDNNGGGFGGGGNRPPPRDDHNDNHGGGYGGGHHDNDNHGGGSYQPPYQPPYHPPVADPTPYYPPSEPYTPPSYEPDPTPYYPAPPVSDDDGSSDSDQDTQVIYIQRAVADERITLEELSDYAGWQLVSVTANTTPNSKATTLVRLAVEETVVASQKNPGRKISLKPRNLIIPHGVTPELWITGSTYIDVIKVVLKMP